MKGKCFLFAVVAIFICAAFCSASEEVRIRQSRLDPHRSFTFRNITGDIQYISSFPLEQLMKESYPINRGEYYPQHLSLCHIDDDGDSINVYLYYRVFTSLSDAEEKIMEALCGDSAVYADATTPEKVGEIGDNCWYNDRSVWFIRNNVVVHINTFPNNVNPDQQKFTDYIKSVDRLLCESPKVSDSTEIKAPEIVSTEMIPNLSTENTITIKVNAVDPQGRKLYYSYLGWPWGVTKESNGILKLINPKILPAPYTYSKLLIWVENEDNIVTSIEYTFLETSVQDSEDHTVESPRVFILHQNAPNPFNPATSISFSLSESRNTRLIVYDTLGRTVRTLVNGPCMAGKHVVRWDGRDDAGAPVSSGVYLSRLSAGGVAETRRMTLMR